VEAGARPPVLGRDRRRRAGLARDDVLEREAYRDLVDEQRRHQRAEDPGSELVCKNPQRRVERYLRVRAHSQRRQRRDRHGRFPQAGQRRPGVEQRSARQAREANDSARGRPVLHSFLVFSRSVQSIQMSSEALVKLAREVKKAVAIVERGEKLVAKNENGGSLGVKDVPDIEAAEKELKSLISKLEEIRTLATQMIQRAKKNGLAGIMKRLRWK